MMPTKPKTNQPKTPEKIQLRDFFETPRYAIELLLPYIPESVDYIYEPACGNYRISNVFIKHGYFVHSADLLYGQNFLTDEPNPSNKFRTCIVTNPPYSLKFDFIKRAMDAYEEDPFAFLIPFDLCEKMISLIRDYDCQAIVPNRRIDYLTPNILENIWRGQNKNLIEKEEGLKFKNWFLIPDDLKYKYQDRVWKYTHIEDVPNKILRQFTSSQFHSVWLTRKFYLPEQLNFVDLSIKDKENIL
jgi:hypothetical protein